MSNILISPPPTTLLTGLLQLSGGVAISSTPVYVTDQNNTASPLALATANVNVNTTSGSALVNIKGTGTTSSSSSLIVQNSAGTNVIQALDNTNVYFAKAIRLGGTSIYDVSGYMSMFNSGNSARIGPEHFSTDSSSWYADASGSRITLSYLGYGLINNNWLVGSGASNTARLSVKGSGSTSATNSILVQNSAGTQLLKVRDDNYIEFGTGSLTNYNDNSGVFTMWDARPTYLKVSGTSNFNNTVTMTGTGTTSATTSLLIQDSALTQLLKVTNDGTLRVGNLTMSGQTFASAVGDLQFNMLGGYSMRTLIAGSEYGRLSYNGNWSFSNGTPFNASSKLQVRASGATSATSCFLLENSSATQLIKVTDDGKMTIGTGTTGTAFLDVAVGGGSNPPLRLKGYSDAGTSYLISAGTESFQDNFKIKMVNGNVTMGTQLNGYTFGLETFNGVAMHIANAGNIGMGTTSPNVSAKLDISSTTQGFLPPRMTTAQKLAIGTPANGLMVFDTSLNQMSYYNGVTWINW